MTFKDKAKEILHHEVDEIKEDKRYDEKLVLEETKHDLLELKEDVSYATTVLEQLRKTNRVDQQQYTQLEAKLRENPTKQEAVREIADIVGDITQRYDNLQVDQKEKIRIMTDALRQSKQSLSGLKNEVMQAASIDYEKIEQELTEETVQKLEEHRYSKPFAGAYKNYIHEKVLELKEGNKQTDKNRWDKIKSSLRDWFFGLIGAMFIGKEVIKSVEDKISSLKDTTMAVAGKAAVENVKEHIDHIPKTPEQLKEDEAKARKYIRDSVKKYTGKELTDEQVERVAKRIDLSQKLKDGTSEWNKILHGERGNMLDASVQTLVMPFEVFTTLAVALDEEGIVSLSEMGLNVVGNTVEYGLKGFKLFGTGLSVVMGKVSLEELSGHIAHIYEKSPFAAKHLLFALVYRSMDGPLMKGILNAGEYIFKLGTRSLFEASGDIGVVKNAIKDMRQGSMNTAIKQMKQTNELLKKCHVNDTFLTELIGEIDKSVNTAETFNSLVVEAQGLDDSADFLKRLKTKVPKGSNAYAYLVEYERTARGAMNKARFLDNIGAQWAADSQILSNTFKSLGSKRSVSMKNRGAKVFVGDNSVRHIIMDFAHNIEAHGKSAHNILANRDLFAKISDKLYLKKIRALGNVMHGSEVADKFVRKFNTVDELADFTENMKLLARKAPSTAKFLIGKSPIFLVGGLAMAEGDTASEKMHALWEGMMGLVPLVGPCLILRDGLRAGEGAVTNWGEAAIGGALLTTDAVHIWKAAVIRKDVSKIIHMFTKPAVDVAEVVKFGGQTGRNIVKMVTDGAKLVQEGKMTGFREKLSQSFKSSPKKKRPMAAAAIAALSYGVYEMMPEGMDKEAEVLFSKYKNDPNGLDKALAENRPTFDQDTKNECLNYAIVAKLGLSMEHADLLSIDYHGNTYTVSLPVMIEKQYGTSVLTSLQENLVKVEPDAQVAMNVRGAVAMRYREQLAQQLKNDGEKPENIEKIIDQQLEAMGYDPNVGKS